MKHLLSLALLTCTPFATAQSLRVETATPLHPVSPTLYGLMTEEINHSYEGGLYPELLRNRTMRTDWAGLEAWGLALHGDARATIAIDKTTGPSAALPTSLKLTVDRATTHDLAGISNAGWWGLPVAANTTYTGSLYAKGSAPLVARLVSDDTGSTLAEATITTHGDAWAPYNFTLRTTTIAAPSARNHFELLTAAAGTVSLQLISLMPPTYAHRANGLRMDLMQKMADMHPTFLRLPGGNYLEGDKIADRYDWKRTIGPVVDRPGHQAPWTYWSTDGLGLLEFLEWCEDLRVEPVLAVYAGYSLKGEKVDTPEALAPFVQDALDEVEYLTGDASTRWGAERIRNGHPAPFPLHYVEIGNEDWLDHSGSYEKRYPPFAAAFRKRYPALKLIATTPVKSGNYDVVDDHYYKTPEAMFALVHKYDETSRTGPKIFVGEWATRSGSVTPSFGDALGDAAFMTGLEQNSDVIVMAAYAPLLVNINPGGMQWATDLIGYDAQSSFGSPSFYAQSMFAAHLGDTVVKATSTGVNERFFSSATTGHGKLFLKLVNASDREQPLTLELPGIKPGAAKTTSLHAATYNAENSITRPEAIKPTTSSTKIAGQSTRLSVPPLTIEVLEIPLN